MTPEQVAAQGRQPFSLGQLAAQQKAASGRSAFSPAGAIFSWATKPANVVGNLLQGDVEEAGKAALNFVAPGTQNIDALRARNVMPSDTAAFRYLERNIPNPKLFERLTGVEIPGGQAAGRFAFDMFADPLTWLTAGGASGARSAGRAANFATAEAHRTARQVARDAAVAAGKSPREVEEAVRQAVTPAMMIRASVEASEAVAAVPRKVSLNLQVPGTRGKLVPLVETSLPFDIAGRVAGAVPTKVREAARKAAEKLQENFTAAAGTNPIVYRSGREVGNWSAAQKAAVDREAAILQAQIRTVAKENKDNLGEVFTRITKAMDNPAAHAAALDAMDPRYREIMADVNERLRKLAERDVEAGIMSPEQLRENYVTHRLLDEGEVKRFANDPRFAGAAKVDNPYYIERRAFSTIDEGEAAGYKFEMNPARLLQVRAHASIDAQAHKALDEFWAGREGAKQAGKKVPDLDRAHRQLADAKMELDWLSSRPELPGAKQRIAAAREAVKDANIAVRAAEKTVGIDRVRDAEYALREAEAARPDPLGRARDVEKARAALREAQDDLAKQTEAQAVLDEAVATRAAAREAAAAERKAAHRGVLRARKNLARAQKTKDPKAVASARKMLREAVTAERQAARALGRAEAGQAGTPRQLIAGGRELERAKQRLDRVQSKVDEITAYNVRQAELPAAKTIAREDWDAVMREWEKLPTKYFEDVRVSPEVKRDLLRAHEQVSKVMRDPKQRSALFEFMKRGTARWKALALLSPGHHLRNAQDDSFRAFMAGGRNPRSYVQAMRLVFGKTPPAKFRLRMGDGTVIDGDELMRLAEEWSGLGQGFTHEVREGMAQLDTLTSKAIRQMPEGLRSVMGTSGRRIEAPGTGRTATWSRRFGNKREDAWRLGTFIELLKKGDDPITAGRTTRMWHMDYGEISKFVETTRTFWLPFITFTAKALPLMGKRLVTHPGTFANVQKGMEASHEAAGNPDLSTLRVGERLSFAVPLPGRASRFLGGGGVENPIIYNPERTFSFGSINQVDPTQFNRAIANMLGPGVRTPIELTGHSFFRAGEFPEQVNAPAPAAWLGRAPLVGGWLGDRMGLERATNQEGIERWVYSPKADIIAGLLPAYRQVGSFTPTETRPNIWPGVGSFAFGVRLSPYDIAKARAYAEQNAR